MHSPLYMLSLLRTAMWVDILEPLQRVDIKDNTSTSNKLLEIHLLCSEITRVFFVVNEPCLCTIP